MFAVDEARLITGKPFDIGVGITLYQPTVEEVLNVEDEYLKVLSSFTSEPFDMPYYLDQMGIDFEKIKPFELFCILATSTPQSSSRLLFGDLNFEKFKPATQGDELVLVHENGAIIDSHTRERIADCIRRMNGLPKNNLTSCENKFTHDLMIRQQKKNIDRAQRRAELFGESSQYATLVSSLAAEWHSYDAVLKLKIGQFNDAIIRLGYKHNADNLNRGLYAGAISYKNINKKDLDWMRPIKTKIL